MTAFCKFLIIIGAGEGNRTLISITDARDPLICNGLHIGERPQTRRLLLVLLLLLLDLRGSIETAAVSRPVREV